MSWTLTDDLATFLGETHDFLHADTAGNTVQLSVVDDLSHRTRVPRGGLRRSGRVPPGRSGTRFYGRWDDLTAAHAGGEFEERAPEAAAGFHADGAFDPDATRAGLERVSAPVLVVAGEFDAAPTPARAKEVAALFPNGRLAVVPGTAHYPWITDTPAFVESIDRFLD